MRKFVQNKKMTEKNLEDLKVKEYMNKYIKELQRHFDMSDKRMRLILYKIYKESSPVNIAKKFFKNAFKTQNHEILTEKTGARFTPVFLVHHQGLEPWTH